MTDLSNMPLKRLEAFKQNQERKRDIHVRQIMNIDAEIERRKSEPDWALWEPDWALWEPKWQAFREAMGRVGLAILTHHQKNYIRALIAAHNTPLAGEEWWQYRPEDDGVGPEGVSPETHEIKWLNQPNRWLPVNITLWRRDRLYRYRPKQTGEMRP